MKIFVYFTVGLGIKKKVEKYCTSQLLFYFPDYSKLSFFPPVPGLSTAVFFPALPSFLSFLPSSFLPSSMLSVLPSLLPLPSSLFSIFYSFISKSTFWEATRCIHNSARCYKYTD